MADPRDNTIGWYRPEERGIIPLDRFYLPRSDRKLLRNNPFHITADRDFEGVMRACAEPRPHDNETETWINEPLITAYSKLHHLGYAHSIEAYLDNTLVGGLYGVSIAAAFFGESMFIRANHGGSNTSKLCLAHLVRHLNERGYLLLDTQFMTAHLLRFGAEVISRFEYENRLQEALQHDDISWGKFVSF